MTTGIGIDIVDVKKIREAIKKRAFVEKIFTVREIEYCNKYRLKDSRFGGRFAAKEAVAKALGTGFGNGIGMRDIEISSDSAGRPKLFKSPTIKKMLRARNVKDIVISISHCHNYSIAVAELEK